MKTTVNRIRKDEQGFTLVELAIVMIIIGLLIGGILKGQELITNARVTTTASSLESLSAAANGFRDQYNALPGDMNTATTRIQSCALLGACVNGDGNGRLGLGVGAVGAAPGVLLGEGAAFFGQLLAADYITGADGSTTLTFGQAFPTAPIGGGFLAGDSRTGATGFNAAEMKSGVYVVLTGSAANVVATQGTVSPSQAATIDRRIDDGTPNTGSLISDNVNAPCRVAAPVAGVTPYNQVATGATAICALAYHL